MKTLRLPSDKTSYSGSGLRAFKWDNGNSYSIPRLHVKRSLGGYA